MEIDYLVYDTKEESQEALNKVNSEFAFKGVTKTWDRLRIRNDGKGCFRNPNKNSFNLKNKVKTIDTELKNEKYVEELKDEKWFYTKTIDQEVPYNV